MKDGQVFLLKDQIEMPEEGVNSKTFYKDDGSMIVLHAVAAGSSIPPHYAPGPTMVQALEGKAILRYGDEDIHLQAGDSLILDPAVEHDVKAVEPYKFALLISRRK